jgi:hypothetical protein
MANLFTKDTILTMLDSLRFQAVKAGLITEDQKLLYAEGVAAGNVPPRVWLDHEGQSCPFLPTMEVLNKKEQYRIIQGAIFALMAINNNRGIS